MGSLATQPTIYLLEQFPLQVVEFSQTLFDTIVCTDPEVVNWRENASAILVREKLISASDIEQAKKLKVIGKQGVGIDIIDQDACHARRIPILNTPGANAQAVAELVLALTMAVARQLRFISVKQVAGEEVRKEHCSGVTLTGKAVGIIGMGHIGQAVARIFRGAFNSPIYAYDPFAPPDAWEDIPHIRIKDIDDMLPHVDILTPHLPLNPKTRNMLAWPQFQRMKKNSILINAARGGIVNERDLTRALHDGILFGAGLDCHEEEPPTLARYAQLWKTGRVVSTPHIGATTAETQIHTGTTALKRVYDYLTQN
jgi:phosphoglycerate dehydrogenase-like enzyme